MKTYKEFLKEPENKLQIDEDLVSSASKTLNAANQAPLDNTDEEPENIVKKPKVAKQEEPLTNIDDIDAEDDDIEDTATNDEEDIETEEDDDDSEDEDDDDSNIDMPSIDLEDEDGDDSDELEDDDEDGEDDEEE
jgi:hypothetical protein